MKELMFSRILKYDIYNNSKAEFMNYITNFEKIHIISGNPEVLNTGLYDDTLFRKCNDSNSVIIPDGIGLVIASRIVNNPVKEKIAGIEVMDEIIKSCEKDKKSIYLLGAKQEILDLALVNLKAKYSDLNIVGSHNGYFDVDNCEEIIEDIKAKEPYAIFVAMGCPRQEKFINAYMDVLPAKVFMGVGGSFDIIAGKLNRAPEWMIKAGLEWLYRVSKEPQRIIRLGVIPKFLMKVVYHTYVKPL